MVGIDVSKATLAVTVVDPDSRCVTWQQTVPNTPAGIRKLVAQTPPAHAWVLEPTGAYGLPLVREGLAAQRTVLLAPPKQAKDFLRSLQQRAKTDRLDSHGLALYGLAVPLRPYRLKEPAVDQLDQVLAARTALVRAHASLSQQAETLPYAAAALQPAIAALRERRDALDEQIATLTKDTAAFPQVAELRRVPGIGPITAAAVSSRLQAIPFVSADAFVAYVGLDVRVRDSGQRKGQRALTRQGDAELRKLLYLCAQASLRAKDSPFKEQYERELAKGLPTTAALCAVARKLAHLCWSLVHHGTKYDRARIYRHPKSSSSQENALD